MNNMGGKRDFCTGWWIIFLTMLSLLIPSILVFGILTDENYYIIQFFTQLPLLIPSIIGLLLISMRGELSDLGFKKFPLVLIPVIILIPFVAQQFVNLSLLPFNKLLEFLFDIGKDDILPHPHNTLNLILGIISICILAPLIEEFLCRGVFMHYLKPYGLLVSLTASSLAFSLLHFDPKTFILIFFLGILFGGIRILTNSLWACILAHSANNILAFILQLHPDVLQNANIFIVITSIILFPLLFILLLKLSPKKNREKIQIKPLKKMRVSVGAILCLSVYELYALLLLIINLSSIITGDSYLI